MKSSIEAVGVNVGGNELMMKISDSVGSTVKETIGVSSKETVGEKETPGGTGPKFVMTGLTGTKIAAEAEGEPGMGVKGTVLEDGDGVGTEVSDGMMEGERVEVEEGDTGTDSVGEGEAEGGSENSGDGGVPSSSPSSSSSSPSSSSSSASPTQFSSPSMGMTGRVLSHETQMMLESNVLEHRSPVTQSSELSQACMLGGKQTQESSVGIHSLGFLISAKKHRRSPTQSVDAEQLSNVRPSDRTPTKSVTNSRTVTQSARKGTHDPGYRDSEHIGRTTRS